MITATIVRDYLPGSKDTIEYRCSILVNTDTLVRYERIGTKQHFMEAVEHIQRHMFTEHPFVGRYQLHIVDEIPGNK